MSASSPDYVDIELRMSKGLTLGVIEGRPLSHADLIVSMRELLLSRARTTCQSWRVGHWVTSLLSTMLGLCFFFGSDCVDANISWGIWNIVLMFLVAHNLSARSDMVPPHLRPSERSSSLMVSALSSLDNCCRHENLSRSIVRFSILVTLCVVNVSQSSQSCSSREGKTLALRVSLALTGPGGNMELHFGNMDRWTSLMRDYSGRPPWASDVLFGHVVKNYDSTSTKRGVGGE